MTEIIIVAETDRSFKFLKNFEKIGVKITRQSYVGTLGLTNKKVFFEISITEDLARAEKIINTLKNDVVVMFDSKMANEDLKKELNGLVLKYPQIKGIMDTSLSPSFYNYFFAKVISSGDVEKKKLIKLIESLDSVILNLEDQLEKVKKAHKKIVPKRKRSIKGIAIEQKYSVGEGPGGEFFDYVQLGNKLIFFLSSTPSYVLSSMILSYFGYLAQVKEPVESGIQKYLEKFALDMKEFRIEKLEEAKERIKLLIFSIDLSNLTCFGYNFGESFIFGDSLQVVDGNTYPFLLEFFDKSKFQFKLNRGSKIVIVSPGVRENCKDILGGKKLTDYIKGLIDTENSDILDSIFFELKKDLSGDFLKKDATISLIEVDKNAIIQV